MPKPRKSGGSAPSNPFTWWRATVMRWPVALMPALFWAERSVVRPARSRSTAGGRPEGRLAVPTTDAARVRGSEGDRDGRVAVIEVAARSLVGPDHALGGQHGTDQACYGGPGFDPARDRHHAVTHGHRQPPRIRVAHPGEDLGFDLSADLLARAPVDVQQVGAGHNACQPAGERERDRQPPDPVTAHEERGLLDGGLRGDGDAGGRPKHPRRPPPA